MIALGNKVKDKLTGFIGVVVSRIEYLNGCIQYGVKPPMGKKDKKMPEVEYIDEKYLVFVSKGISITPRRTGGVMVDAPKE